MGRMTYKEVKDVLSLHGVELISKEYKNRLLIGMVERGDEVVIPRGDFVIKKGDKNGNSSQFCKYRRY